MKNILFNHYQAYFNLRRFCCLNSCFRVSNPPKSPFSVNQYGGLFVDKRERIND